jgi:hypothetical protein
MQNEVCAFDGGSQPLQVRNIHLEKLDLRHNLGEIPAMSRQKVVYNTNGLAAVEQLQDQSGTDKTCASRNQICGHNPFPPTDPGSGSLKLPNGKLTMAPRGLSAPFHAFGITILDICLPQLRL